MNMNTKVKAIAAMAVIIAAAACSRSQTAVYLDESLKMHETVYPAAGTDHSAVRLSIADLEQACDFTEWVDVCKLPEN
jgi:prolyl-tRNA editing enzyme YbaK/EbsC (Cys-tRNA(Pro) deacylase)